jgi:hypothetical protein
MNSSFYKIVFHYNLNILVFIKNSCNLTIIISIKISSFKVPRVSIIRLLLIWMADNHFNTTKLLIF